MKYVKISALNCPDVMYTALEAIWNEGDLFEVYSGSECSKTQCALLRIGE